MTFCHPLKMNKWDSTMWKTLFLGKEFLTYWHLSTKFRVDQYLKSCLRHIYRNISPFTYGTKWISSRRSPARVTSVKSTRGLEEFFPLFRIEGSKDELIPHCVNKTMFNNDNDKNGNDSNTLHSSLNTIINTEISTMYRKNTGFLPAWFILLDKYQISVANRIFIYYG